MRVENSTVRNLLSASYMKLNVKSRAAAVSKARELGLITPYPPEPPK
jgi:DNA-binding CsgD family transcriptional regulator